MITNSSYVLGAAGTVQAVAADISLANHKLAITGSPVMDYRKIASSTTFLAAVAEVLGVVTYTPTAANSTLYTFAIQQWVPATGKLVNRTLTYFSLSSGDTATTICDAFRAQLLTLTDLKITGTGTATLILTAQAGSPIFKVTNSEPVNSTVVVGTPGVRSRGTYADLVAAGVTGAAVGQTYSQITFNWISEGGETVGMPQYGLQRHTLYVNDAATNYAAFAARMAEVVNAYAATTTVSDPEAISLA